MPSTYHQECEMLRGLVAVIKNPQNPKSFKETTLREARALAAKLGFDLGDYNSSEFGVNIP